MSGDKTRIPEGKPVVESDKADNIYVFMVGHGGDLGLALSAETAGDAFGLGLEMLNPDTFASTLCEMWKGNEAGGGLAGNL